MADTRRSLSLLERFIKPSLVVGAMVVITASLFVWALASKDKSPLPVAKPVVEKFIVEITDTGYLPQTIEVPVGATVEWINRTNDPHRIAANPQPDHSSFPALDSAEPIGPNATYSFTFMTSGTYVYNNHYIQSENNGEVKVTDAQTE